MVNWPQQKLSTPISQVSDRNFSQMWEKDCMVRCNILKIFFLLYIAKYWCTFCCNWYCTWGTPLVFNINHYKPKNMICSWNWNTEYSSQAGGFLKCHLNNTLVSWLSLLIPVEVLLYISAVSPLLSWTLFPVVHLLTS